MINLIRRLLDNNRLAKELAQVEVERDALKKELISAYMNRGPRFVAVKKDFNADKFFESAFEHIIQEMEPVIEHELIRIMKTVSENIKQQYPSGKMYISVADDMDNAYITHMRYHIKEMNGYIPVAM